MIRLVLRRDHHDRRHLLDLRLLDPRELRHLYLRRDRHPLYHHQLRGRNHRLIKALQEVQLLLVLAPRLFLLQVLSLRVPTHQCLKENA